MSGNGFRPSDADIKALLAEMKKIAAELASVDAHFEKAIEYLKRWS